MVRDSAMYGQRDAFRPSCIPSPPYLAYARAGLRALQGRQELEALVNQVKITRDRMPWGAKVI